MLIKTLKVKEVKEVNYMHVCDIYRQRYNYQLMVKILIMANIFIASML
jgi:hypothetical protein